MTPWGHLLWTLFSGEQWDMLTAIAKMTNQTVDEVIIQTVAERHFKENE